MVVCHKGKALCIAPGAVAAHLKHGDILGGCTTSPFITFLNQSAAQELPEETEPFRVSVSPNPFGNSTWFLYELPSAGKISISIHDAAGKEVAILVQTEQKPGTYRKEFRAEQLPKGLYYYRALFTTARNTYIEAGKLIVVH